ncbi:hypothetical protein [Modestobacter excelsi]|nr:hypothetical protein [Modestobacter excelsi]
MQRFSAATIDAWATAIGTTAAPEEVAAGVQVARVQFAPDASVEARS